MVFERAAWPLAEKEQEELLIILAQPLSPPIFGSKAKSPVFLSRFGVVRVRIPPHFQLLALSGTDRCVTRSWRSQCCTRFGSGPALEALRTSVSRSLDVAADTEALHRGVLAEVETFGIGTILRSWPTHQCSHLQGQKVAPYLCERSSLASMFSFLNVAE